jgi:hypothetical protein
MFAHNGTHRRMLAAVLAFAAPAFLLTACNDDPLFEIPPDAPTDVAVAVQGTSATVTWTPGAGATSQEVRMSPLVPVPASAGTALLVEDDRVQTFADNTTSSALFEDLTEGTSYSTTVTAINGSSRTTSDPIVAVISPSSNAPVITAFYADETDPTILIVEWTGVEGAENYRVTLTPDDDSPEFIDIAPASATSFPNGPVNDGTTYTAQVCALLPGGEESCSNTPTFTADFFPWDEWFPTSLHETGQGKITYYSAANGGFEGLINIPYEQADCIGCHSSTDGRPPVSSRTCDRCHDSAEPTLGDDTVEDPATCLGCHGRQAQELNRLDDVHVAAGFTCMSCHTSEDVHGDGNSYLSLQDIGAIKANCENCHDPATHSASANPHPGVGLNISCVACHAQAQVTCNNCHFEAELSGDGKVFYGPPKADWLWLGNRPLRDGSGETEVYVVNYQSVKWQDTSFVAWGHYTPHSISVARGCPDCHGGTAIPAIAEYNAIGELTVAEWNVATEVLEFPLTGIVPFPEDYETSLKFDFVTTPDLGATWEFLEPGPDAHQVLTQYVTPLSFEQMERLDMVPPGQ